MADLFKQALLGPLQAGAGAGAGAEAGFGAGAGTEDCGTGWGGGGMATCIPDILLLSYAISQSFDSCGLWRICFSVNP